MVAIARRRQFSASEKRRILAEADRCSEPGQIGALLRREGIYSSNLALSDIERWCVLDALNSGRFANCSPRQTYATLFDEGVYPGSARTIYRLLANADQVREQRRQLSSIWK